jgi:N-acetylmuramoyl-L-alanine amidase
MVKIFIDPGHGGSDPGAQGYGLQEKNITLQIATRVRDILLQEYKNVSVQMSRTGDQTVSLNSRTNAANQWGADFYLSIHINSGGGNGFESYVYSNVGKSTLTYQNDIHREIAKLVDLQDRGAKRADLHVLRESKMDALLTENGFIDHPSDAGKLNSTSFLDLLARGHVNGLVAAFSLSRKNDNPAPTPSPAPPQPPRTSGIFKVQIGAYRDRESAESLAGQAKSKGFQTYLRQEDGLYKVQIGAFSERSNAEDLVARARAAGFQTAILID